MVYCYPNTTIDNKTSYPDDECDNFFKANILYEIPGIPGLSSNASECLLNCIVNTYSYYCSPHCNLIMRILVVFNLVIKMDIV